MGLSAPLLFSGWVIMYSMLRLNYCYCCVFFSFSVVFIFYIHYCLFESYHIEVLHHSKRHLQNDLVLSSGGKTENCC